jgi:hypothetical protein
MSLPPSCCPGASPRRRSGGYAGDLRRYEGWCALPGLAPYPASPERLVNYVAHLAGEGKAPSSMERALAAILPPTAYGACPARRPRPPR